MAVTNEEIQQWFQTNPGASDTDIYNAMQTYKVDQNQLNTAMGFNPEEVGIRYTREQNAANALQSPGITNLMPNAPSTQSPSVYDPALANQSFADVTPASMGIAGLVPQTTMPITPSSQAGSANYANLTDQEIQNWFQNFATQNANGAYQPDLYDASQQIKDALKKYNADPNQVNRVLQSGATTSIYGGAKAGGTDVNLRDFANEFAMATSKNPLVDANKRITLDPALAAQAAQNELDTLFNPQKGSLMPFKDADFEYGGKYYGQIGNRDKMIADFYNDPANKAKLDAAQKTVFDKYGVPESMRLAPRAISPMLARTEVKPSAEVDPNNYSTYEDYSAAQNAASLKAYQDQLATYKKYGIDNSNPTTMSNLRAGVAGRDPQAAANFYGMTLENYNNLLSGDKTKPMGEFSAVYGTELLAPIQQVAARTARAAGLGTPDAKTIALAKKYPEIFAKASSKWADYLRKNFPQTLEYESVLGTKKKASGSTVMPDSYKAGGRVKLI